MVYYKNKNKQHIKKQLTQKQNPSELLNSNSKKTKKRLILNGGHKINSKKDNSHIDNLNIINRNVISNLVNSISMRDNNNDTELQEGGYSKVEHYHVFL